MVNTDKRKQLTKIFFTACFHLWNELTSTFISDILGSFTDSHSKIKQESIL